MGVVEKQAVPGHPTSVLLHAPGRQTNESADPPWLVVQRAARSVHPTLRVPLAMLALEMAPPNEIARLAACLDLAEALLVNGEQAKAAVIAAAVRGDATRSDLVIRALATGFFAMTSISGASDILDELDLDELVSTFITDQPELLHEDLGRALVSYACGEFYGGHVRRARRTAGAALRLTQTDCVRMTTGMIGALAALFDGDLDGALVEVSAFTAIFAASSCQHELISYGPWTVEISVLTAAGRFDEALQSAASGQTAAALIGTPWMHARGMTTRLTTLLESGRWTELICTATDRALLTSRVNEGLLHGCVALTHARSGNSAAADVSLQRGAAVATTIHSGLQYLLWAQATQARLHNDVPGALAAFRQLSQTAQERHVSVGVPSLIFDAARVEWAHGDRAIARWWLSTLPRSVNAPYAMAFEHAGAALVRDNFHELEVAAMQLATVAPFESAKLCVDAARAASLAGERTIARRLAGRAMKMFIRLGAAGELRALEQELHATGLTPSVPRVVAGSGAAELTEAERRVVGLVREGYSNKDIAIRVGVSTRTVETHLSRVYTKLGVGSRLQLATLRQETWTAH